MRLLAILIIVILRFYGTMSTKGNKVIYRYESMLKKGILRSRYKRFLADVNFEEKPSDGDPTVVHCPNTGSMRGVLEVLPRDCACSVSKNEKRKYRETLEMIKLNQTWVGIHSALANNMVAGAFEHGYIDDLAGFSHIKREVKVSNETRIDFELTFDKAMQEEFIQPVKKSKSNQIKGANKAAHCTSSSSSQSCLVEVKSVTMGVVDQASGSTWAVFPDTVSERAQKHALTLLDHVKAGGKAAILYLIQRDDCSHFSISSLDPSYGKIVSIAAAGGVEILPYYCRLCPDKGTVELLGKLPFVDTYKDSATQESLDVKAPKSKTSKAKRTSELKKRKAEK